MKLSYLSEPELEFGQGTHICPRMGITEYDVYDTKIPSRRDSIVLGVIGTATNIETFQSFLEKCSFYLPSVNKDNKLNLWIDFCGVNLESGFRTKFTCEERHHRKIANSEIREMIKIEDWNTRVNQAVELYYEHIKFLSQNRDIDIIVCLIPKKLCDLIKVNEEKTIEEIEKQKEKLDNHQPEKDVMEYNFRRLLKAKSMHLNKPI